VSVTSDSLYFINAVTGSRKFAKEKHFDILHTLFTTHEY
jgi:hypothetical protein